MYFLKRDVILLSCTGVAGFSSLLYVALQSTSSINASIVNSTSPLVIVLLARIFLREKLSNLQYLGTIISFLGVIWVISQGNINVLMNFHFNNGDLLVIVAVLFWALYSLLIKTKGATLPKRATFLTTLLLAIVFLLPFCLWESRHYSFNIGDISVNMVLAIIYLSIFPTLISFICWNEGVIRVGPTISSNFLHLITVFAGLFAILIGEKYTTTHFLGALLILGGVLIVSNPKFSQKR
ncbi:DMT family transporter [Desulforamulus aquiferis]|nr:DMT family transporter [Desulforamulus aquiferis]